MNESSYDESERARLQQGRSAVRVTCSSMFVMERVYSAEAFVSIAPSSLAGTLPPHNNFNSIRQYLQANHIVNGGNKSSSFCGQSS